MQNAPRNALSRAIFFLSKADACKITEKDDCLAYLEASIIFARAVAHRVKECKKEAWDSWKEEPAVRFFREERDFILKENSPKIGQKIYAPFFVNGGESIPPSEKSGPDLFYFKDSNKTAAKEISDNLNELEKLLSAVEL